VVAGWITALVLDIGSMYLLYLTPLYAATLTEPLVRSKKS
jgi:hypothetical protein